jgi:transcriptional regulator with XRE-family HTH domain
MENYISINIKHFLNYKKLTQDSFGEMFGLKKGVVNQYLLKKSNPKIETIQKICAHFEITIDDFINKDLSKGNIYGNKQGQFLYTNEPNPEPYVISPNYVETLQKTIIDKEKIISMLEEKLNFYEKNRPA